jgi:NAD(P)H-hydrate epimerase
MDMFKRFRKPIVIDADALNVLSRSPKILPHIPPLSVITPHNREFERLFGNLPTQFDRVHEALEKARQYNMLIVLKGPYTFIATPGGKGYFNQTGNPGMATAGTGDVLTGIIAGLLCQGYASDHAAIAGVYLHGYAGDLAAAANSQQALVASDIVNFLGQAFKTFM